MGWAPSAEASKTKAKFIYLLNADEFDPKTIPKDAFVVYQGHHGDLGAQYADVCLPGSAYTEKSATWVNTEGRVQRGREAVNAPGAAREDWKIVRALSEAVSAAKRDDRLVLPYDDIPGLRERMWNVSPTLVRLDAVDRVSAEVSLAGMKLMADGAYAKTGATKAEAKKPFGKTIENFYRTDPISRACVALTALVLDIPLTIAQVGDDGSGDEGFRREAVDRRGPRVRRALQICTCLADTRTGSTCRWRATPSLASSHALYHCIAASSASRVRFAGWHCAFVLW